MALRRVFALIAILAAAPVSASAQGIDLTTLVERVNEGLAGAPSALRKRYAKLAAVLAKADRAGLADDFQKVQRAAKECAGALAGDTALCAAVESTVEAGLDQLTPTQVEAALAIADSSNATARRRGDGSMVRGRDFAADAQTAFEEGQWVEAAGAARQAAKTFEGATKKAARALAAEVRKKPHWQPVQSDLPGALAAVWVTPGSPTVYAVGRDDGQGTVAMLLRGGPEGFVRVPLASGVLLAVGPVGAEVWAVGTSGGGLSYVPTSGALAVISIGQPEATLNAVWGTGPSDVWVAGSHASGAVLSHWDGSTWMPATLPAGADELYSLAGAAADDLYAVGSGGLILHWDGVAWMQETSGTTEPLRSVAVGGAVGTIVAAGGTSSALVLERGSGGTWTSVAVPAGAAGLTGISVPVEGDPWACGRAGTVLRRKKGRWISVAGSPLGATDACALHVDDEGGVWVAGGGTTGTIAYYGGRILPADAGVLLPQTRWTDTVQPFLYATCAFTACHVPPLLGAGLDMETPEAAAASLPRVPSTEAPLLRIAPARPSRSYLWHKLNGTQVSVGGSGTSMPQGETLPPGALDLIRAWILEGAPVE